MADFALVIYEEKIKKEKPDKVFNKSFVQRLLLNLMEMLFKIGFFKSRFGTRLFYYSKKKDFIAGIQKTKLFDNVNVWIIKLPFTAERFLMFNKSFFNSYVMKVCSDTGNANCFMPTGTGDNMGTGACSGIIPVRSAIFKALVVPILDEIYVKSGMGINTLDIVIIPSESCEELYTMIELLEPYIKYITIASSDNYSLDAKLFEIFADSGLSISVSSDYKNILKSANLIINMQDSGIISKYRLNNRSLVINYGDACTGKIQGENAIINGIEYNFRDDIPERLGPDVSRLFSRKELTEIIMAHRLELLSENKLDHILAKKIMEGFKKDSCMITGFIGRRGILKIRNVQKAVGII